MYLHWVMGPWRADAFVISMMQSALHNAVLVRCFSADVLTVMVRDWISMPESFSGLFTAWDIHLDSVLRMDYLVFILYARFERFTLAFISGYESYCRIHCVNQPDYLAIYFSKFWLKKICCQILLANKYFCQVWDIPLFKCTHRSRPLKTTKKDKCTPCVQFLCNIHLSVPKHWWNKEVSTLVCHKLKSIRKRERLFAHASIITEHKIVIGHQQFMIRQDKTNKQINT